MDTDVLVAGAGPIGLTTAIELRRRGISCRIVDPLDEPRQYAKAVGIQPRTLELFENMGGVLRQALDASTLMRGQIMYTNGVEVGRVDLTLPDDVPYWFLCLPQYSTERILTELGTTVERGVGLTAFEQSDDAVTCTLSDGSTVTARYLVGSDGAHSVVRKGLGLSFEGGAFAESYMLGDVEVDWSIPQRLLRPRQPHHRRRNHRRPTRLHPTSRTQAVPHVDARSGRVDAGRIVEQSRCTTRFFNRQETGTPSHPGRARQTVPPRTDNRLDAAMVLGLPHQPPHRRRLRSRTGFVAGDAAHIHPPRLARRA